MSLALAAPAPDDPPLPAPASPPPGLRAALVGPDERARHPQAQARELAPGLHELVAVRVTAGLRVPTRAELRRLGLDPAAAFARARRGTCGEPLRLGRAGPRPGVHVHVLGGPDGVDTAAALFELAVGPSGLVFAVPARGTALLLAPDGLAGAFGPGADPRELAAPRDLAASLRFLAVWTAGAHARLAGPVSPAVYWRRPGRPLAVLAADARADLRLPPGLG